MPILDLSYQHWQGTRIERPAAWVLALAQTRGFLARRAVRALLLVGLGFTLAWTGLVYVESHAVRTGPLAQFADVVRVDASSFRTFLVRQRLVHLLLCLAAADLVALDRRHRALALYLSRPLGRRDYVLAKGAALAVPLSLSTWVPALVLVAVRSAMRGEVGWLRQDDPWLLPAILGYAVVLIVPLALLTLALSSVAASPRQAAALVFATIALPGAAGEILAGLTRHAAWRLLSVNADLDQVASWWFGTAPPHDTAPAWSLVVLAGWGLAAAALLAQRVRGVDVVRGR